MAPRASKKVSRTRARKAAPAARARPEGLLGAWATPSR